MTLRAVDSASPHVRRVARAGVLALCDRLDTTPGRTLYAEGKARFETADERVEITPPFRFEHWENAERIDTGPLREHLTAPRLVGLLVVRLGGYGAGVYEDERLVEGKHGVRFVKNRNKKGGSSSNRFRRRRVEQAKALVEEAGEVAATVLIPWRERAEFAALGGDQRAVEAALATRPDLTWLRERAIPRFLDVPEPRHRTLEALPYDLYAVQFEVAATTT